MYSIRTCTLNDYGTYMYMFSMYMYMYTVLNIAYCAFLPDNNGK